MAKEGKKVSKGFGFYLIMILLVLVGAFIAVVCAMIIMPETKILGYYYFNHNDKLVIPGIKTDKVDADGNVVYDDFDFSDLVKISVESKNSEIVFDRGEDEKTQVIITYKTNGFSQSKNVVGLDYDVTYSNGELKVTADETIGFLNFSKDLKIEVLLGQDVEPYTVTFEADSEKGNIRFGHTHVENADLNADLTLMAIDAETKSGNITIEESYYGIPYLTLKTETGNIQCNNRVAAESSLNVTTQKGTINLSDKCHCTSVVAKLGDGKLTFDEISGDLSVRGKNFTLSGNKIAGSLDGNDRNIEKAKINVTEIGKDIGLPYGNASDINIVRLGGQAYIETTKGNVTIGGTYVTTDEDGKEHVEIARDQSGISRASFIKTQSGKIDVIVNDSGNSVHDFQTSKGKINVEYETAITSKNYIVSESGDVSVKIHSNYQVQFVFRNKNKDEYTDLNNKLNIDLLWSDDFKNPLGLNGYEGNDHLVDIATDGKISCSLLAI